MTAPGVGVDRRVSAAVKRLKEAAHKRDESMEKVHAVRRGEFASVWPDSFSERYPTAIVANFVDVAARDFAANIAGLPSLQCSAGQMKSQADKSRAAKKNKIGSYYWRHSGLKRQMSQTGADQYITYGFLPAWVEADYDAYCPRINLIDPRGCYYELDRYGETQHFARCWKEGREELAARFPEYASKIITRDAFGKSTGGATEVVQWVDDSQVLLFLPDCQNLVIASYQHGMDFCPIRVAERPGVDCHPRGQFDDVLWVQLAHSVMAALTLEAGHKAVQAPIAVPTDVQELSIGPDAVVPTDNPQGLMRLPIEVPSAAFALGEQLSQEMHEGAGYPDTRLGVGPAGGSTGRGISALEGGFDSQISINQDILGEWLRHLTEMCFKMDVKLFANKVKTIDGVLSGESYRITYRPSVDIGDSTECELTYGFASGLNPNAQVVTMLQLQGGGIIDRDTFRKNLPFDIDADLMHRAIDEERLEDAILQGLAAWLQASPQMIAQGGGAQALQGFDAAVKIIQGRRNGKDMVDLVETILVQPMQAQQQQAQQAAQQAQEQAQAAGGAAGGAGGPLPGVSDNGLAAGVAPGQAGMAPGGRPSLQDLVAGFSASGAPNVSDTIRRKLAAA